MNAAIDVRLRCEIYDCVNVIVESCEHGVAIADVSLDEVVSGVIHTVKVLQISGVGQRVEVDDFTGRQLFQN